MEKNLVLHPYKNRRRIQKGEHTPTKHKGNTTCHKARSVPWHSVLALQSMDIGTSGPLTCACQKFLWSFKTFKSNKHYVLHTEPKMSRRHDQGNGFKPLPTGINGCKKWEEKNSHFYYLSEKDQRLKKITLSFQIGLHPVIINNFHYPSV